MNIDLHDRAALIDAITVGADRPVAFLVGSPLSWDAGGGVPGVDDMLVIAKELVKAKLPNRVSDFETAIKVAAGADAYHRKVLWLSRCRGRRVAGRNAGYERVRRCRRRDDQRNGHEGGRHRQDVPECSHWFRCLHSGRRLDLQEGCALS